MTICSGIIIIENPREPEYTFLESMSNLRKTTT